MINIESEKIDNQHRAGYIEHQTNTKKGSQSQTRKLPIGTIEKEEENHRGLLSPKYQNHHRYIVYIYIYI